jgi:hypothetical protein
LLLLHAPIRNIAANSMTAAQPAPEWFSWTWCLPPRMRCACLTRRPARHCAGEPRAIPDAFRTMSKLQCDVRPQRFPMPVVSRAGLDDNAVTA